MAKQDFTQDIFTFQQIRDAFKRILERQVANIIEGRLPPELAFVGDMFAEMTFEGYESISKNSLSWHQVSLIEQYLK
jgi:hypothetical protein